MSARTPASPQLLEAAAKLADLDLAPERVQELVPVMSGIYAMLDALEQASLGEVVPAAAFNARWER